MFAAAAAPAPIPAEIRNRKFSAVDVHGRNVMLEAQAAAILRKKSLLVGGEAVGPVAVGPSGRKGSWVPQRKASAAVAGSKANGYRAVEFNVAEDADLGSVMKTEMGSRQSSRVDSAVVGNSGNAHGHGKSSTFVGQESSLRFENSAGENEN